VASSPAAKPQPAVSRTSKREADAKPSGQLSKAPEPVIGEVERRVEAKKKEAEKPSEESLRAAPSIQVLPSPAQPVSPAPPLPPSPASQQRDQRKEMAQQGALPNPQAPQDQLQQAIQAAQAQAQGGARQLYFTPP